MWRRAPTASLVQSWPITDAWPAVGGKAPVRMFIVVVLPAPLVPRKPKTSRSWTPKVRFRTATRWLPLTLVGTSPPCGAAPSSGLPLSSGLPFSWDPLPLAAASLSSFGREARVYTLRRFLTTTTSSLRSPASTSSRSACTSSSSRLTMSTSGSSSPASMSCCCFSSRDGWSSRKTRSMYTGTSTAMYTRFVPVTSIANGPFVSAVKISTSESDARLIMPSPRQYAGWMRNTYLSALATSSAVPPEKDRNCRMITRKKPTTKLMNMTTFCAVAWWSKAKLSRYAPAIAERPNSSKSRKMAPKRSPVPTNSSRSKMRNSRIASSIVTRNETVSNR
mmetsp:Transcript_38949/g.120370  ORF Transcript_38949/g.120370 Transcript_38949/m.120370 type:complete len:334 (-) Transcript_38949:1360-2361(-)